MRWTGGPWSWYVVRAGRQARRTASCPDAEYLQADIILSNVDEKVPQVALRSVERDQEDRER
jgi:hypothetical protein